MRQVLVLDADGKALSPCSLEKARHMLAEGKASLISQDPFAIRLSYAVDIKPQRRTSVPDKPGTGKRLLLHICCGPCSTYAIRRMRDHGFEVTGFWYNPNIHPVAEHERRRECMLDYAKTVDLAVVECGNYDTSAYFQAIKRHEAFGERCARCYRLRLERTADVADQNSFDAFSTTLLISPYQQQALIRSIGEELAAQRSLTFYFENLRRGWSERGHMARQHNLYQQQYCGCIYSEREASERRAPNQGEGKPS